MLAEHLTLSLVMAGMVGLVVLAWVNFSEIRKPNLFQSPHDVCSRGFIAFFQHFHYPTRNVVCFRSSAWMLIGMTSELSIVQLDINAASCSTLAGELDPSP